jgi:hypothetical protein
LNIKRIIKAVRASLNGLVNNRRPFQQRTFSLGAVQSFQWDKALEMAAVIEDEELSRKMARDK